MAALARSGLCSPLRPERRPVSELRMFDWIAVAPVLNAVALEVGSELAEDSACLKEVPSWVNALTKELEIFLPLVTFGAPALFSLDAVSCAPDAAEERKSSSAFLPCAGLVTDAELSDAVLFWMSVLNVPTALHTDLT